MRYLIIVIFIYIQLLSNTTQDDKYLKIKTAQTYIKIGDDFREKKEFKKALKSYKKAQQYKSDIAFVKIRLLYTLQGNSYYKQKKYQKAKKSYLLAKKYKSKNVDKRLEIIEELLKHHKSNIKERRKLVDSSSPLWTHSIGRLEIPTKITFLTKTSYKTEYKKCSATLVNMDKYEKTKVIITASHCLTNFDSKAGKIHFLIKNKKNKIIRRDAQVYFDSEFNEKVLENRSDYAILILNKSIKKSEVTPLRITKDSFMQMKKDYRYSFASLAGYSNDIGEFGRYLTFDPRCNIKYYNKMYGKSSCVGFKGASGGAVILSVSNNKKEYHYSFIGVISHFKNSKYQEIFFAPHHIFYPIIDKAMSKYNQ